MKGTSNPQAAAAAPPPRPPPLDVVHPHLNSGDWRPLHPVGRRLWHLVCLCCLRLHPQHRGRCARGAREGLAEARTPCFSPLHRGDEAWRGRARHRLRLRGARRCDAERRRGPGGPWPIASASALACARQAHRAPSPQRQAPGGQKAARRGCGQRRGGRHEWRRRRARPRRGEQRRGRAAAARGSHAARNGRAAASATDGAAAMHGSGAGAAAAERVATSTGGGTNGCAPSLGGPARDAGLSPARAKRERLIPAAPTTLAGR